VVRIRLTTWIPASVAVAVVTVGLFSERLAADGPAQPIEFAPTPQSLVYGDGETRLATIIAVADLDGDGRDDLLVHQRPDGLVSREASYALISRDTWPSSTTVDRLGAVELLPPGARQDDGIRVIGVGDANNDGRVDIAGTRTIFPGPSPEPTDIYLYFSPESWPRSGSLRTPSVRLTLPEPTGGLAVRFADLDGDGLREVLVVDDDSVRILAGRADWPSTVAVDSATSVLTPRVVEALHADLNQDGAADLALNLGTHLADMAFLSGRAALESQYDLIEDADWTLGTGDARWEARFLADVTGDGIPDMALVDGADARLIVFEGGAQFPLVPDPTLPHWSISGVELTDRDTEHADFTGDGAVEILVNRRSVFLGHPGRSGDYVGDEHEFAVWNMMPRGHFHSGDVNGDGITDILINDPSAAGVSRAVAAGSIRVHFGPLLAGPDLTPTPRASATYQPSVTPEPTDTEPTDQPSPTSTTRATDMFRIHLPRTYNGGQ
jgi:hypothetical protein